MTQTKPNEPDAIPKKEDSPSQPAAPAFDPGQTRLLPPKTASEKLEGGSGPGISPHVAPGMLKTEKPWQPVLDWFRNLSQASIIWISFSITLVFVVVLVLLIFQSRQTSKTFTPAADEQLNAAGTAAGGAGSGSATGAARQAKPIVVLTDDEYVGQAPLAAKSGGPVISETSDPELAAMVDALKKRTALSADSKVTGRDGIVTRISKGEFRGFKISVEEKIEKQKVLSEAVVVTMPQKGYVKTVNRVLDSIRESDPERFRRELRNAGLEIVASPPQPGSQFMQVQLRAVAVFGKEVAADFLLSGKSVGKIFLGMPTTRLENMLLSTYVVLKRKVLVNDIYHDVYKVLDQSNEPLFFVYENQGRIWGIAIISDIFKTAKGIGIGSSLGQIRTSYPRVEMGLSEKKIPYVRVDGVEGLFVIQNEGVDIVRGIFPSHIKVISVLIGRSLEFE
ncbi:MAG TPA: hypothetical protein VLQ89_08170 [Candidatus Binatia bacterium]|nr:hypothetical protein [Candidatus Binatia bacterium]